MTVKDLKCRRRAALVATGSFQALYIVSSISDASVHIIPHIFDQHHPFGASYHMNRPRWFVFGIVMLSMAAVAIGYRAFYGFTFSLQETAPIKHTRHVIFNASHTLLPLHTAVVNAPSAEPNPSEIATNSLLAHLSSCNATLQRYDCEAVAFNGSSNSCVLGGRSQDAGFGHQMSEVLMWLRYAHLEHSSFVFEPFSAVVSNEHGVSYEFSNSFFGLVGAVQSMHGIVVSDFNADLKRHHCDDVKRPGWLDCGVSGSSINCWVSPRMTKLFASYAPCLRQSALCFGDWVSQARALPLDPAVVNVAWHIRVGSGGYYYTTSSSFYREVLGFMAPFLRGRKCVHHLIGGAGWDRENGEYVTHIGSIISDLGLSAVSQVSPLFLSVKDSFLYLMSADVAISTSSSFSDIAALFSSFPVFISPPPKHGMADNWFEFLPDAVYVDGWLYKQKQSGYITNVWRAAGVSPFQAVNDTLHQRLAARFPLAAHDAPS